MVAFTDAINQQTFYLNAQCILQLHASPQSGMTNIMLSNGLFYTVVGDLETIATLINSEK